jgi:6-phosphogluconolactonase
MSTTPAPHVYIGTYTVPDYAPPGNGEGIYHYRLSSETGELARLNVTPAVNPSYLMVSADGQRLYATSELSEFVGRPGGGVSAFAVDAASGDLSLLDAQPTHGEDPCHVSLDASGEWVVATNYHGGSVTVLPLEDDGRLAPVTMVVAHAGSGPNADRQDGPHPHSSLVDPETGLVMVADLGIDEIVTYRLDAQAGGLLSHDAGTAHLTPGAGPRHLAFGPGRRWVYCTDELDSTVTVLAYDARRGLLRPGAVVSTVPAGFTGENYPAHLRLSPNGRFLYVSNRGHDSLAVFAVDAATGALTPAGHYASGGHWPRHFAVDPTGRYLLVGNQESESVVTLRIDPATGGLTHVASTHIPNPACILFAR